MIIKINGVAIKNKEELMEPKVIRNNSNRNELTRLAIASGAKVVFALAAATMCADVFFSGGALGGAVTVMAAGTGITDAFHPVKVLLLDVADPLCYVMFVWGCIECIAGRPASGLNRMKYAAIGYIAINWIPVVMSVIRSAGPGA